MSNYQNTIARHRSSLHVFVMALFLACCCAISAQAQGVWQSDDANIRSSKQEHNETLGVDSFGDVTDQYTGTTKFTVTDVDLPGNGTLPVRLQRSLQADYRGVFMQSNSSTWAWTRYDVPYLSGIFKMNAGWKAVNDSRVTTDLRCTYDGAPDVSQSSGKPHTFESHEYHRGVYLTVPGQGRQPIGRFSGLTDIMPTAGGPYTKVSKEFWFFTCLPTTSNGVAGEGFVGRSPDGKRFYFDRIVRAEDLELYKIYDTLGPSVLRRSEYRALLTRVEDQFGNWVNYGYSNVADLTSITASDGRNLTLTYVSPGGALSSVTDGTRTWTYSYTNGVAVTHPDGTVWRSTIGGTGIQYNLYKDCSSSTTAYTGDATVTVQLRSGAVGTFSFAPLRRGRSYVWYGTGTGYYCEINSGVYSDSIALYSKVISGPGLPEMSWNYLYGSANGCYENGSKAWAPACTASSPQTVQTEIRGPSGFFKRYTFGNRVSNQITLLGTTEGRLDRVEEGSLAAGTMRDTAFTWQEFTVWTGGVEELDHIARVVATQVVTQNGATYSTTNYNWDLYRSPQTIVESGPNGGSRTTQYTFHNDRAVWVIGQVATMTSGNNAMSRAYNANASLDVETNNGVSTSYSYTSQGEIASITHPRSLVHTFSNYKRGVAQSEQQPEGVSIARIVNDAGFLTSETNGEGYTTVYGRDAGGRLTLIDYPRGDTATIEYSGATKSIRTLIRGALLQTTIRDGLWRPTSITTADITVTKSYDAESHLTFESSPNSSVGTTTAYDALGRVTRVTYANGDYRSVSYGAATLAKTDERGKVTTYTYRAYGNPDTPVLMSITAPIAAASVTLVRDTEDMITSATQGGFTRSFGYDSRKYQTSETNPESGTITFGRDAAGNMTSRTVGAAQTIYTYDGQNRLTGVTFPSSSTPSIANSYNTLDRLLTASSSVATRSFGYDENGNLTNETIAADGYSFSVGYGYNGSDQLDSITYPRSGSIVSYAPNALGRPTQVSGFVNSVSYWPSGQVNQIVYGNGATSTYGQNARLWPSSFAVQRGGAFYVWSDYVYDSAGNLNSVDDASDSSYTRAMTYDDINRVITTSGPWGGGNIAYDGAGNIVNQIFGSYGLVYSYDTSNRLSGLTGNRTASFSYDAYGNVTNDSINAYTYDDKPHLRCVNCAAARKVEFAYDATDRRLWSMKDGVKTYEIYNSNGNLLIEFTPDYSNKLIEYFYLGTRRVAQRETQ